MNLLRSNLLPLVLLIGSISFASPPISIDSLMKHLGIQGFSTEIVGELEPFGVELLTVKDGAVVETTFLGAANYFNGGPDLKSIEIVYSKLNRSQYKFTVSVVGHSSFTTNNEHILDWKGSNSTYGTPVLEIGGAPYLFTGELYTDPYISTEDLRKIESVKYGLMLRVIAKGQNW